MKTFFVDLLPKRDDDFVVRDKDKVVEMQIPCCDGSLFTYLIPRKENKIWVAACWDDTFDFIESIDSDDVISHLSTKWPFLANQLQNGLNERFADSGLAKVNDPEESKKKWAVLTEVEGSDFPKTTEDFWANPSLLTAVERVQKASGRLYEELEKERPEYLGDETPELVIECERKEEALFTQFGLIEI